MSYSVQPRDRIFVKGYGFLYFAKNMNIDIVKNICKNFMLTNLPQISLKLIQKEQLKK